MAPNQPTVAALIPAAGASSRMGGAGSKALLELAGRSAIERVVAEIFATGMVQQFVILAPAHALAEFQKLSFAGIPVRIAAGGATRQDSVRNGLELLESDPLEKHPDFIVIHDAARCLVGRDLIERSIRAAFIHKAVTAAIPVTDSMLRKDDANGQGTALDRSNLWAVQTPQVFSYALLLEAHRQNRRGATDDASLVEHLHPIHVIEGSRENIKLTTQADLKFACAVLKGD